MFVGWSYCGSGDSVSSTPTNIQDITYIEISNGIYDELFGTDNPDVELNDSSKKWDFDTRFYAKFQGDLLAGNVNYVASIVSSVKIKRRKNNEHTWFTISEIPIETNEDFEFELLDRYAQGNQDYYYALIPVINDIEGNINKNEIHSEFKDYFILDKDISYPIIFNTSLNVELNKNIGVVSTLGSKYPFVVSNGMAKYKTGSLNFSLALMDNCNMDFNIGNNYNYREQFEEWITNGKPKILKDFIGNIFMMDITSSIPIDYSFHQLPSYQIQFVEVGDPLDEMSMYNNDFTDIISTLPSLYPE